MQEGVLITGTHARLEVMMAVQSGTHLTKDTNTDKEVSFCSKGIPIDLRTRQLLQRIQRSCNARQGVCASQDYHKKARGDQRDRRGIFHISGCEGIVFGVVACGFARSQGSAESSPSSKGLREVTFRRGTLNECFSRLTYI